MQLNTIKFLQESQERHGLELGDNSRNLPLRLLDPNAQRALVGLGESMVRNGTVPDINHPEISPLDDSLATLQMPHDSPEQLDPPEWFDSDEPEAPRQTVDPPRRTADLHRQPVDPALKDTQIISWHSIRTTSIGSGVISGSNRRISQNPAYASNLSENIISESLAISLGSFVTQDYYCQLLIVSSHRSE